MFAQPILQVFIIIIMMLSTYVNAQDYKYFHKSNLSYNPNQSPAQVTFQDSINDHCLYELDRDREILLFGSGGLLGITGLVLMNEIEPLTLDEINQLDPTDVNEFDRNAVGTYRDYLAGDLLLYGSILLPLTFLTNEDMKRDWKTLGIMGLEVLLFQAGLNAVVKGVTQRIRPYAYDPNTPLEKKTSKDAKVSFYSGHTSTAAAMSFYTAKVFSDYLTDGLTKTLIWTGAVIYPAVVGYLRVSSANHFATDVIVGYAVGAMIGSFIPQLHKTDKENGLSVFPSVNYGHYSFNASYSF